MTTAPCTTTLTPDEIIEDAAVHAASGRGLRQTAKTMGIAPHDLVSVLEGNCANEILADLLAKDPNFNKVAKPKQRTAERYAKWAATPAAKAFLRECRREHARIKRDALETIEARQRVLSDAAGDE